MAKRKTREQKMLTTIRKLQDSQRIPANLPRENQPQPTPSFVSPTPRFSATPVAFSTPDYSYVKKDLVKIVLLAALAIGIQVMLTFLSSNPAVLSIIPLLGRR